MKLESELDRKIMMPQIMRNAVHALNHEQRWIILEELNRHKTRSYKHLLMKVDCSTFDLKDHLNIMIDAGLINQVITPKGFQYQISSFAVDLVTNMWYALWPPLKHQSKGKKKGRKKRKYTKRKETKEQESPEK